MMCETKMHRNNLGPASYLYTSINKRDKAVDYHRPRGCKFSAENLMTPILNILL